MTDEIGKVRAIGVLRDVFKRLTPNERITAACAVLTAVVAILGAGFECGRIANEHSAKEFGIALRENQVEVNQKFAAVDKKFGDVAAVLPRGPMVVDFGLPSLEAAVPNATPVDKFWAEVNRVRKANNGKTSVNQVDPFIKNVSQRFRWVVYVADVAWHANDRLCVRVNDIRPNPLRGPHIYGSGIEDIQCYFAPDEHTQELLGLSIGQKIMVEGVLTPYGALTRCRLLDKSDVSGSEPVETDVAKTVSVAPPPPGWEPAPATTVKQNGFDPFATKRDEKAPTTNAAKSSPLPLSKQMAVAPAPPPPDEEPAPKPKS
jgi:hypothetical protein